MSPSLHELGAVAGEKVRVKLENLPVGNNPREVFTITEAPVSPNDGAIVLRSNLTDLELHFTAAADVLTQKVK